MRQRKRTESVLVVQFSSLFALFVRLYLDHSLTHSDINNKVLWCQQVGREGQAGIWNLIATVGEWKEISQHSGICYLCHARTQDRRQPVCLPTCKQRTIARIMLLAISPIDKNKSNQNIPCMAPLQCTVHVVSFTK